MQADDTILVIEDGSFEEALSNGMFKDIDDKILLLIEGYSKEACGFLKKPKSMEEIDGLIESLKRYGKERLLEIRDVT